MTDGVLDGWALAAGANRWALYASMLIACGSALFILVMKSPPAATAVALRLGRAAGWFAAPAYGLGVGLGGAAMLGGDAWGLFTGASWILGAGTSLGFSAALGVPAMATLIIGFNATNRAILALGVALAVASFVVTGHAATAEPRWLMSLMVGVHLLCAAFWLGALAPLFAAARRLPVTEAGALMTRFSRFGVYSVAALILSGSVIACVQMPSLAGFIETDYGARLAVKLGLVAVIVGLADYNKVFLTPRLIAGDAAAVPAIRRSIAAEYILYVLILGAAASLTMTAPPRTLD